ncbi:MAG: carboxysome peptide B [Lamprobacter sp.]|uniref:carboxysome peptide B n=1 Tax=Lamprobacter sp. TaxID=3100796 RepID=UPI002B25B7F5|nr:carboxysome peptide B [Lamprobacter sp.]MEA3640894.1 carboxysome peptide B [Lamprobacter sp.]
MEINQVVGTLYCTERIEGLRHCSLQILKDRKGNLLVATDPVGVRPGNWVFTVSGSAGRLAMDDPKTMTDLAIGGIIDFWQPAQVAKPVSSSGGEQPKEQQQAA